jgi:hypothetical protein
MENGYCESLNEDILVRFLETYIHFRRFALCEGWLTTLSVNQVHVNLFSLTTRNTFYN